MPLPVFAEEPWFQWLPVPAMALDASGRLVAWNREAAALTGYRAQDVLGRKIQQYVAAQQGDLWQKRWLHLLEAEAPSLIQGPLLLRVKEGTLQWVWTRARRLMFEGQGYILVTFQPNMGLEAVPPRFWSEALDQHRPLHERLAAVLRIAVHILNTQQGWLVEGTAPEKVQVLASYPEDAPPPPKEAIHRLGTSDPAFIPLDKGVVAVFPLLTKGHPLGALLVTVPGEEHLAPEARIWLQTLAFWAAEMLYSARAREKEVRERQLHALTTLIMQQLNAEPDLFHRFPAIAEDIRRLSGCDRVSLAIHQEDTFLVAALDKEDVTLSEGIMMPVTASSASEDILAGRPHFTPDLAKEAAYPVEQQLLKAGYRSRINLPLKIGEKVLGALNLAWRQVQGWQEEVIPHLLQIASAMAQALERSRLLREESRRRRTLESLYILSRSMRTGREEFTVFPILLERLRQLFHTQAEAILVGHPSNRYTEVLTAHGLFAPLARHRTEAFPLKWREMLYFKDPTEFLDCLPPSWRIPALQSLGPVLLLPLNEGERGPGYVLVLARAKGKPPFSPHDLEHLRVIGEMLSHTLARMHALEEARSWLALLQALHRMDRAITREPQAESLYRLFFLEARRLLAAEVMAVYVHHVGGVLSFVAGQGWPQEKPPLQHLFLEQSPLLQRVLESRRIQILYPPLNDSQLQTLSAVLPSFQSLVLASLNVQEHPPTMVLAFIRKLPQESEHWSYYLESLMAELSVGLEHTATLEKLHRTREELEQAYDATIEALARAVEMRDFETENHTRRVAELTVQLARRMGIPEDEIVHIRRGALLHDIGKLAIPDRILLKPGPLDENEWAVMRMHPVLAYDMLKDIPYLQPALDIPYCHHERWDGSGYPRGLKGEEIPLAARIFAVADVWDALTHDRPYRTAWPREKALKYICEHAGKHFDPNVVQVFVQLITERYPELKEVACLPSPSEAQVILRKAGLRSNAH